MLKQIESSTVIRITTTSGPQYRHEIEAQFTLLGGRTILKHIVLQHLFAKAKGTNKHAKWTGRKQLWKNCSKLRKTQFPRNFPAIFRNWIGPSLTAIPPPPTFPTSDVVCTPRISLSSLSVTIPLFKKHCRRWCRRGHHGAEGAAVHRGVAVPLSRTKITSPGSSQRHTDRAFYLQTSPTRVCSGSCWTPPQRQTGPEMRQTQQGPQVSSRDRWRVWGAPSHSSWAGLRAVLKNSFFAKDSAEGQPLGTTNHQPPTTANRHQLPTAHHQPPPTSNRCQPPTIVQ